VFGNVGSIISFRTSADDARIMLKYFEPKFEEHDLVHMHNRHFAISMTIEGEKVPAFSAISLNLPPYQYDCSAQIIQHSREQYATTRDYVERYVAERYLTEQSGAAKQTEPRRTVAQPRPQQEAPQSAQMAPSPVPAPNSPAANLASVVTASFDHPAAPAEGTAQTSPPAKRKRVRKRKRKNAESTPAPQPAAPAPASTHTIEGEGTIQL
jgi:hypothetical protein